MSRFTTPLRFEHTAVTLHGRQIFRITEEFVYEVGATGLGVLIRVPVDFETDLGSIPRLLWCIVSPTGKYGKAFVLHDNLYRKRTGCSKIVADAILYEALDELECPWWLRNLIFNAVYFFGHRAYNFEAPSPPHTELAMLDASGNVKPHFEQQSMLA